MQAFIERWYRYIAIFLILAISIISYLLGKNTAGQTSGPTVTLQCSPDVLESLKMKTTAAASKTPPIATTSEVASASSNLQTTQGKYVGSKNGTKYYTPGCPGTNRIKPENYIWFSTEDEAQLQGYSKGSC